MAIIRDSVDQRWDLGFDASASGCVGARHTKDWRRGNNDSLAGAGGDGGRLQVVYLKAENISYPTNGSAMAGNLMQVVSLDYMVDQRTHPASYFANV
jgi:hypothetical protein